LFTHWHIVASSFLIEAELAADPITGQHIHLGSDLGHALTHPGRGLMACSEGIGFPRLDLHWQDKQPDEQRADFHMPVIASVLSR
jgi:hypothetical protein